MAEYIEREAAIKESTFMFDTALGHCKCVLVEDIEKIPAADVVEVVHGEWQYNTDDFTPAMRCSVCSYNKPIIAGENIKQEPNNYCPNCGADMRTERKCEDG